MIARHVTATTLCLAAQEVGVVIDLTTQNAASTRHRVKLYPVTLDHMYRPACKKHREGTWSGECQCRRWSDARGDSKYQRSSASSFHQGSRVHAVCWHGFRDFFRAVYRIEPSAVFVTAFDTWRGSEDFEARFRESGHKNIGSQMYPVAAAEACRCPESGEIDAHPSDTYRTHGSDESPYVPLDSYGSDEADGAACRAMANALRATGR